VSDHVDRFLAETAHLAATLDREPVRRLIERLVALRARRGRLFIVGFGGSAGNAGHAVADLRRLAGVDCLCPLDNVSDLTAAINDDGWDQCLVSCLRNAGMRRGDGLLILSVGGGDVRRDISTPLVRAAEHAAANGNDVFSVVGRADGDVVGLCDVAIVVPTPATDTITMHSEIFQSIIWHLLVSDPRLATRRGVWETIK
jgi:D-sedoheptulose 7-phosphate isomerase